MIDLNIHRLRRAYLEGSVSPDKVIGQILEGCDRYPDHNIWITRLSMMQLRPYLEHLKSLDPARHPLWGVPFAIKDNIDLADCDTTAACEAFRYRPEDSSFVVQRLIQGGAIPIGKTNLDQFATGLVGTRSPWGACRNAFDPDCISGGSSAGSAVAVALGLASFSLGTDTAGSGRVPAAFNNLVGLKPTRGLLSSSGMVPACRSLDCMSIFALTADDAETVLRVAEGDDPKDVYSRSNPFDNSFRRYGDWNDRITLGVIADDQLQFFGDSGYADAYSRTLAQLRALGCDIRPVDFEPFIEAARLLYEGPWVAERYIATSPLIEEWPEALLETTRSIIAGGAAPRATSLFSAEYRLRALQQACHAVLDDLTCLLTPTAGGIFTISEVEADPVALNSRLGYYTNYMNLLDLCAVALPGSFTEKRMPFGITLVGKAFNDRKLLSIANRIQRHLDLPLGALAARPPKPESPPVKDSRSVDLVVCGAHMEGLGLNWQLKERGATLVAQTRTAACYRLFALSGGPPARPGLMLDEDQGRSIDAEIWRMPIGEFGGFVADIPAPLGIGKVKMADGRSYVGFICEPWGIADAEEITSQGGWRAWLLSDSLSKG